jgi:hypothetical protein
MARAEQAKSPIDPWNHLVQIDPAYPHHFVRPDGSHFFLFNKTAWHFFTAKDPQLSLDRARALGANVIRVGLEQRYYYDVLKLDAWPWGGTRANPDFSTFNEPYWDIVDERIRLAAAHGIGINLTLFNALQLPDTPASFALVRPYLERVISRLAKHSNIFCWEVHNEYVRNPGFQANVGAFLKANDPLHRPVISSNGTTDYPLWPNAPWMDMALIHHCTGSTSQYDLRDWYLAIARNLRVFGKPAFNNETGRERQHKNDDPVHRRKQLWLASAAGGYTTWHSWDGCEGIDDASYVAPGQEFSAPYVRWWSAQQYWRIDPDFTAVQLPSDDARREELVPVALASASRELLLAYLFTRTTGTTVTDGRLLLRLPNGDYRVEFFRPTDGTPIGEPLTHVSRGLRTQDPVILPSFTDDLALRITRTVTRDLTAIPGTQ